MNWSFWSSGRLRPGLVALVPALALAAAIIGGVAAGIQMVVWAGCGAGAGYCLSGSP